jgi:hypothetical protein
MSQFPRLQSPMGQGRRLDVSEMDVYRVSAFSNVLIWHLMGSAG